MKIAVLAWGSLIWDWENPPIESETWFSDGPFLPIEFVRISKDGRLTLVVLEGALPIPVLWNFMKTDSLAEARENLRAREKTPNIDYIHYVNGNATNCHLSGVPREIRSWAKAKNIEAVIWTGLQANFETKSNVAFNEKNVISYLKGLDIEKNKLAERYIRKTPNQIKTKMRCAIEEELGWTSTSEV